ncbi:HdeD family acid-resistance protein [Beijerinckia indica]|uniref:HdeD protein n=1 Tax=Beijerinckia indica subsp. indica (strain ATCC 9039 / DSM 1715 / NCIMB 8712) TaxID=395963 RepID=B2II85_BEII9|nr:HdeD family acid-resistance protein [Beijerinckia indica]ACB94668.1 conserved hypothetical protein [Beijerinckia indica subsp. indica ATCC 9039]
MSFNTSASISERAVLPLWACLLLGVVFIAAGIFILGDVILATLVSTVIIGLCAIVGGLFEIFHAFWTKGWGGFFLQIFLGVLYVAGGVVLVNQPVVGSLILTYVLGLVLLISGFVRLYLGVRFWSQLGWLLSLSGAFGVIAGLVILIGWPASGLWVLGYLLGFDMIFQGVGWLCLALPTSNRVPA